MRRILFLLPLLLIGCAAIKSIEDGAAEAKLFISKGREILVKAETALDKAGAVLDSTTAEFAKHKDAADTNKDGKTTPEEWLAYIASLFGVGGLGTILVRNAKSNARKDAIEARVANLEVPLE